MSEILFKLVLLYWLKSLVFLDRVGNIGSCDFLFPVWMFTAELSKYSITGI